MTSIRYLIMAGVPKSATTSVFSCLFDHPQICAANRKETYFFARQFDLGNVCEGDETLDAFTNYFSHCNDEESLRLEATPYTIYSKGSAEKIAGLLSDATILFILRDPVERFISDYRFSKQREHPSTKGTFEEYLEWQNWMKGDIPNAIEMGCYLEYLRPFYETFGRNNIQIVFFEEFIKNPRAEIRKLCESLKIDREFYSDYHFGSRNKTINVRSSRLNWVSMYTELAISKIRPTLINFPIGYKVFERIVKMGRSAQYKLNDRVRSEKEPIDNRSRNYLVAYYQPHNKALSIYLERTLPW